MSSEKNHVVIDDDNPEWTAEDFANAKRGDDIPAHIRAAFPNTAKPRGRPVGSTTSEKQQVTLRLDRAAVDRFKAGGPGWQSRINEAVRIAAGLPALSEETRALAGMLGGRGAAGSSKTKP